MMRPITVDAHIGLLESAILYVARMTHELGPMPPIIVIAEAHHVQIVQHL